MVLDVSIASINIVKSWYWTFRLHQYIQSSHSTGRFDCINKSIHHGTKSSQVMVLDVSTASLNLVKSWYWTFRLQQYSPVTVLDVSVRAKNLV
jgi:hypothetical protein